MSKIKKQNKKITDQVLKSEKAKPLLRELKTELLKQINWNTNTALALLAFITAFSIELKLNNELNMDSFSILNFSFLIIAISLGFFEKFRTEKEIQKYLQVDLFLRIFPNMAYKILENQKIGSEKDRKELKNDFIDIVKKAKDKVKKNKEVKLPEVLLQIQFSCLLFGLYSTIYIVIAFLFK